MHPVLSGVDWSVARRIRSMTKCRNRVNLNKSITKKAKHASTSNWVYGRPNMFICQTRYTSCVVTEPKYKVVPPNEIYLGKTYGDYLAEYWNWIYSINCDANNIGDVIFCRGVEFPEPPTKSYAKGPVVMVGDNGLNISSDQAVFLTVMTSNAEAVGDRLNLIDRDLRAQCTLDLNAAGVPNNKQILIDGTPIKLPGGYGIDKFRTVTREYILNVPSSEYGATLAPFLDIVLDPGEYRCVAAGYCFLLQLEGGEHTIYSIARGKPWREGDYISELLYEVNVMEDPGPSRALTPRFNLSNQIYTKIAKLVEKKEINAQRASFLEKQINARKNI